MCEEFWGADGQRVNAMLGYTRGETSMEHWDVPGTGEKVLGRSPNLGVTPKSPLPLEPSWGAWHSCQGDKGAKVTPPGLLPALGDATSALLELHLEQLLPPGALESQPRREKLLGWDGVGGTDVALLGSGWWILELMMLVHTQGKLLSVSRAVGIILKDFCCCGALKRRGKSGKSQTPSMVVWMNHKMLQSLLLFMQGSLKE